MEKVAIKFKPTYKFRLVKKVCPPVNTRLLVIDDKENMFIGILSPNKCKFTKEDPDEEFWVYDLPADPVEDDSYAQHLIPAKNIIYWAFLPNKK